jgi:OFA family oxalate/formate antiporter-like MFS transporter
LTGTSFGGVIVPQLARPLIAQFGWREAMLILSSVVWFVLLPAIYFLVRDRAGDLGLGFDGTEIEPESSALKSAAAEGKSLFGAFATKEFWLLAIGAAALFYPIFATSQQFILHIQKSPTIAASPIMASIAQSMLSATSICGKFLFGWLSDRLSKVRVMLMCCTLMFLASTILLGFLASNTIFIYLIPFGLGYGGTFVLIQLLAVDFFGLREIGKILGALTVIETAGGFLGAQVTGRIASANGGDYTTAFYGVTVAAAIALICVALLNLKMFGAGSEESQK